MDHHPPPPPKKNHIFRKYILSFCVPLMDYQSDSARETFPAQSLTLVKEVCFPLKGGSQGLTAGLRLNSPAIFLLSHWCLCAFVRSNLTTVCRWRTPPPTPPPTPIHLSRKLWSIHLSPLLDKLRRKRAETSTLHLHHAFYPPPLNPSTSLAVQSFMVGPLDPPVRLYTDLPLKQYSTAGWIKDEFMSEEKRGRRWGGSEEGPAASRAVMMRV